MVIRDNYVCSFSEIGKGDVNIAGGKGVSLGEMMQAGIPVPPGFVILVSAYERFLGENNLNRELDTILHAIDHQKIRTIELASKRIKQLILKSEFPEDISNTIQREFEKLETEYVAVRSSATVEDSKSAAWAGQLETYLNITKIDLFLYIKHCWASLFTPRAIYYRFEQGIHEEKISVAVVIQKMVQSEVSGIAFSVHPIAGDSNQLIIEAGFGLAEAIVSGYITPDSYLVEKTPRCIIGKNIITQTHALIRATNGGGNIWVTVPQHKGKRQKLSDIQIFKISELILRIEKYYSFPCDIEWAYEKEHFYITQSRPITTLKDGVLCRDKKLSGYSNKKTKRSYRFHFAQSEFGVLMLDILFGQDSYGAFDYRSLTEQEISRVYLTRRGCREAYQLGKSLLKKSFFKQLINEAALVSKRLISYSTPQLNEDTATQEWDSLLKLWDKFWHICRFCDEPVQRPLEELLLKECRHSDVREMLADHMAQKRIPLSNKGRYVLEVLEQLGQVHLDLHKKAEVLITKGIKKFEEFLLKKYGLRKQEFFALRKAEVRNALAGIRPPIDLAHARMEGCGFVRQRGVWNCVYGEAFLRWKRHIERTESHDIVGSTAHPGKVRGQVVRHMSWAGITKVPKGAVLVTGMTNPQMIPFIKKAAAIVTDEGGLMCHAAIISREMKKPCVVGTGNATRLLKDGDFVEVDANKGVVKIISNAQSRINSSALEKVQNFHWTLSWLGGEWPLLDTYYQYVPEFDMEWMNICGVPWTNIELVFNQNRVSKIFTAEEGDVSMKNSFQKKFEADPQFLVRSVRGYRERVNNDLCALREIHENGCPKSCSNDQLADLFMQARSHFYFNAMVDRYDYHMELIFTPLLEKQLKTRLNKLGKQDMLAEYMNTLVTPHQASVIFQERSEFFRIVEWIRENRQFVKRIESGISLYKALSAYPELGVRLQGYLENWVWMPVLVNNPPSTIKSVWKEIEMVVVKGAPLKINSKRLGDNYDESAITRSRKYFAELDFPQKVLHLIDGLRAMAFLRTEDYVVMSESSYLVIPLYTEIARRLGVNYHDLKEFRPTEIVEFLKTRKQITQQVLRRRVSFNCLLAMGKKRYFFEEDDAWDIWKVISRQINMHIKKKQKYKGVVANKGKITGKVRVVVDMDGVKELQSGEILVVAQVGAEFVPHMRRAGGIVVEHGGLTSHPVIVAREFNIPCVVGMKGLTNILRDGDIIELDADVGIVKLIQSFKSNNRDIRI
jgi:phosphoenolpyruvate synthase/pyruvate phosphate dikinase